METRLFHEIENRKPVTQFKQQGFTLIELIVVIVILGILAATAMPKFIDMRRQARISSLQSMAGALRSAVLLTQGAYYLDTTTEKDPDIVGGTFDLPVRTTRGIVDIEIYSQGVAPKPTAGTPTEYRGILSAIEGCENALSSTTYKGICANGFGFIVGDIEGAHFYPANLALPTNGYGNCFVRYTSDGSVTGVTYPEIVMQTQGC